MEYEKGTFMWAMMQLHEGAATRARLASWAGDVNLELDQCNMLIMVSDDKIVKCPKMHINFFIRTDWQAE